MFWQRVIAATVLRAVDFIFFALGYLLAHDLLHANVAWSAGFGVVFALWRWPLPDRDVP